MLILAAVVAIFVYGMIAAMLGTILPELSNRFQLTPRQNGTIALAQAIGLMLASLAGGPLLDDFGFKIGLIAGLALIFIALLALPRASGYSAIVFLLFLLGLGGGVLVTGANALASAGQAHAASVLNLVNLFFGLGGLATPFVSANLLRGNWVRLCYTIAGFTILTLGIQALTQMPPPVSGGGFSLAEAGPVLGRPLLLMLGFFLFLYVGCEVGVWNWLVRHLVAQGVPEGKALNILSLGFALGMLIGRVGVSRILIHVPAVDVTLGASIAMAVTTWLMLRVHRPGAAGVLVFLAGAAMAPVFPTTLGIVSGAFPTMRGTALGVAITFGWAGLAVSSRIIGSIAGGDPRRLRKALLVIPVSSLIMIGLNLAIMAAMR